MRAVVLSRGHQTGRALPGAVVLSLHLSGMCSERLVWFAVVPLYSHGATLLPWCRGRFSHFILVSTIASVAVENGNECLSDAVRCYSGPAVPVIHLLQDAFVGFRSGAAGNRFLQPRRRAPHRLVFFNERCGVWEQWDVNGDRDWRRTPWSSITMELRSRRLQQVHLVSRYRLVCGV